MRELLLNVCVVAVATALFKLMIPNGTFKKQIGFLLSCFFLSAVIYCFTGGSEEISLDFGNSESAQFVDFSEQLKKRTAQSVAEEMSDEVSRILAAENIYPDEIRIIVNISDYGSISISEIRLVSAADTTQTEKAAEIIREKVGDEISVSVISDG